MKILVIINEDFGKMVLGKNTTLAYTLAAVGLGHDVYVYKIAADGENFDVQKMIDVVHLNKGNALLLVEKYKQENHKIVDMLSWLLQQGSRDVLVEEFCALENILLERRNIFFSEINFVIQRLEPMKAPFPPVGKTLIGDFLLRLKNIFLQNFIFNFPVNAYADKEFPLVLSQGYDDLATPTATSFYGDLELPQKLQKIAQKYSKIFSTTKQKIVFKPDDSAQALGVFAIEIKDEGLNLAQLKTKTIAELISTQLYEINAGKDLQDANEIVNILCFIQFCKTWQAPSKEILAKPTLVQVPPAQQKEVLPVSAQQILGAKKISEISPKEISDAINSLYGKNILMQPFLEGVRLGDIRINLAKMSDGNFKVVGAVFRKSISYDEKNFTTCLTTGASRAEAVVDYLSDAEEKNLTHKIQFILQQLNQDEYLKNKYREVVEIGCDFLIVGNGKDVYFGEANHYCQALIPFSESLEEAKKTNFYNHINGLRVDYEGGLAIVSEIIKQQIALQNQNNL